MPLYITHAQGVPPILQATPFVYPVALKTVTPAPSLYVQLPAAAAPSSGAVTIIPPPVTIVPGQVHYF
jgi:hypothetical protein